MQKIPFILLSTMSFSLCADKPNIVFILADDLGYGEIGAYGQEKIKTPHIDQLAKDGMKFTNHYSGAPVCGPARCVLLTGQHLAHAQIRNNKEIKIKGKKFGGQPPLSADTVTIAKVLKQQGYATGAFGKWGLGNSQSTGSPIKQGFDRFYGYNCQRNAHSYYPGYLDDNENEVIINKKPIPGHLPKAKGEVKADDYRAENYAPDLILAESLKFIDQNKNKPFFLYLPFVEPHVAIQPPQEWIDQYPKEWDKKPYRGGAYLPHPRPRAGYAAMISDLDEHVGTVLARLKKYNLQNNTIVIFTSDNGPTFTGGVDYKFFQSAGSLKGLKGSVYEGGLRVPLIVKWPGKIKPNTVSNTVSYFPDWFPTLAQIAGINDCKQQYPTIDGENLIPAFFGKKIKKRTQPMFWEFGGYGGLVAIRDGKWKLVRRKALSKKSTDWELYNLEADEAEKKNVAKNYPEIVKELEKKWLAIRTVNKNFPMPSADKRKK